MAKNWAITIGINEYEYLQPLKYAKRDAQLMYKFFDTKASFERVFFFSDDSPKIDKNSTCPSFINLRRMLRQLFETPFMQTGDNFWFFFSGHGIRHAECDYLMPSDADPEDIENTAISINYVAKRLRRCGADNVILLLDTCRNQGQKGGIGQQTVQTVEQARQLGVISIFSCSPHEYSYEIDELQHGAFTYALLNGLGTPGGCATVQQLNDYLNYEVPRIIHKYKKATQRPYTCVEPLNKSNLILLPESATLNDIITLKQDAESAQSKRDFHLAKQLWTRVKDVTYGSDIMEAQKALEEITFLQKEKLISNVGRVDYTRLRDLLSERQWQEADIETLAIMLKVAGREEKHGLDHKSIENFPCNDLHTIDELWIKYSDGYFGLSVQKRIWESVVDGSDAHYGTWCEFGKRVGWYKNRRWLDYDNLTFNRTSAPQGHLPAGSFRLRKYINEDFLLFPDVPNEFFVFLNGFFLSLFSRLHTCKV